MSSPAPLASTPTAAPAPESTWAVLGLPAFRAVWLASLFSNAGGLMHDTAAVWTIASLAAAPLWVTLMQTASSLPFLVLGVPAGVMGDLVSPRRVLLVSEAFLALVATVLAVFSLTGQLTAPWLLGCTVLMGIGAAFSLPAWQSLLPELVTREQVPAAVALNSLSLNLARAVGPAVAGLLLAFTGPAVCFAINGLSFAVVCVVLWRGRSKAPVRAESREHFWSALMAGTRYVEHAPLLRTVMLRMAGFVVPASGVVTLFPALARREWHLGPATFGLFMAAYGLGAALAATWLPRMRSRWTLQTILGVATGCFVVFGLTLTLAPGGYALLLVMPIGGAGWICTIATLNASAQATAAPWVRGRALAFNLLCFQGSLAFGALGWGVLANRFGLAPTMLSALGTLALATILLHRRSLDPVKALDLTPARLWAEPVSALAPSESLRPATVTITYQIDPADRAGFLSEMTRLREARLRTGADRWELIEHVETRGQFQERFTVPSWEEHLLQHERVTRSDAAIEARVDAYHRGPGHPHVQHWIHAV